MRTNNALAFGDRCAASEPARRATDVLAQGAQLGVTDNLHGPRRVHGYGFCAASRAAFFFAIVRLNPASRRSLASCCLASL